MASLSIHRHYLWPVLITLLAALLRFHHLGAIEHNVDQAYPLWQALNSIENGFWPLVGQGTSVLFANPALTGYLYVPLLTLTRSALAVYVLVISLNSLAVLLAFRAVKSLLGYFPALVAAALMAVNPWLIEYSRTTWVQSLMPFFTCAIAWLLWPVLLGQSDKPQRRVFAALLLLAMFTQTYLLAYLLLVPVGLLILRFWRSVPKQGLWLGAAMIALVSAVYALGLLNQWDSVQAATTDFSSAPRQISGEAWGHAVRLITGADYPAARGQDAPTGDWQLRQGLTQAAHYGLLALLLLGIVQALIARRGESWISLLWFGLPVLLMSYVGQPVHPFYQLLGLPAGYALVGWAVKGAESRPVLRYVLLGMMTGFGLLMVVNSSRFAEETMAAPAVHDLGALPLSVGMQLGGDIVAHLPPEGVVYADVDQWTLNSFAGTTFPVSRDTRAPAFSIVPSKGGVYVVGHVAAPDRWRPPEFTTQHLARLLPGGGLLTLDVYPPGLMARIQPAVALERASEEQFSFLGYTLEDDSLSSYWRVETLGPETQSWFFQPFVQLSSGGERLTIQGETVPGSEWRQSDIHIHRMTVPLDASDIQIGQYDVVGQRNMIFLPDFTPLVDLSERVTNGQ